MTEFILPFWMPRGLHPASRVRVSVLKISKAGSSASPDDGSADGNPCVHASSNDEGIEKGSRSVREILGMTGIWVLPGPVNRRWQALLNNRGANSCQFPFRTRALRDPRTRALRDPYWPFQVTLSSSRECAIAQKSHSTPES
jgi:hypothetical protein